MLKRVGVLTFVLAAGALFHPAVASAQERFDRGHDRVVEVRRAEPRFTREYVVPEHREDWNRDRFVRQYRNERFVHEDRGRFVGRDRGYRR